MLSSIRFVRQVLLGSFLLVGAASAAGPSVRFGDGLGIFDGYDIAHRSVLIGVEQVPLTPEAATSLQLQLAQIGWRSGRPFGARYSVVRGPSGGPLIDTINVYPTSVK
jgi:hypothetical protein